ncbi:MAG TPA: GPP34 family phosphoprotein [Micromonosporaceae bacterium]
MATNTLERTAMTRLRNILPNGEDRTAHNAWMPLRTALYLIAHDDDTGQAHLDENWLVRGLAGTVLFDLWLARRVNIGWRFDARQGVGVRDSDQVRVMSPEPIGDPLSDNLLAALWNTGGRLRVGDVIDQFAATNLYERVRADMIAGGVLERSTRWRFWLFRTDAYQATHKAYPVRARSTVRDLVDDYRRAPEAEPDSRALALSALVTALGLSRYLHVRDDDTNQFSRWLSYLVDHLAGPTIRDVVAAVTRR